MRKRGRDLKKQHGHASSNKKQKSEEEIKSCASDEKPKEHEEIEERATSSPTSKKTKTSSKTDYSSPVKGKTAKKAEDDEEQEDEEQEGEEAEGEGEVSLQEILPSTNTACEMLIEQWHPSAGHTRRFAVDSSFVIAALDKHDGRRDAALKFFKTASG